jgi:Arc/MetJ-type ribon-helix-helix transcriptional regulator
MATRSRLAPAPMTFDLPEALFDQLETVRVRHGLKSVSEVVRLALAEFDYARFEPTVKVARQISVRIGAGDRAVLKRTARQRRASVGEILRQAIEALARRSGRATSGKPGR